ncbi:chromatin associated protein [Hysterangium stoloniferum]|nr:chromatin associated protein [Hysterangium stoloniferum]
MSNDFSPANVPEPLPDEFDPRVAVPQRVKTGDDWVAVLKNPLSRRITDVDLVRTLPHRSVVCAVRFSPDGSQFATSCDRTTQIYDTMTGTLICILEDATALTDGDLYVRCLSFSSDGEYLVTGAEDAIVRLWHIGERSLSHRFIGHEEEVYGVDFSRDGRLIVSASGDSTVCIWRVDTGDHVTMTGCGRVTSIAFSSDGQYLAAGSLDTAIYILDTQTGRIIQRLAEHGDSVYSVAFTPDGRGLISGSLDKTMKRWDLMQIPTTGDEVYAVTQSSTSFAGHSVKSHFYLFSAEILDIEQGYVLSVAISLDGQLVVSGSSDKTARLWNLQTGETELLIKGHRNSGEH